MWWPGKETEENRARQTLDEPPFEAGMSQLAGAAERSSLSWALGIPQESPEGFAL